jgi:hypothetical protein
MVHDNQPYTRASSVARTSCLLAGYARYLPPRFYVPARKHIGLNRSGASFWIGFQHHALAAVVLTAGEPFAPGAPNRRGLTGSPPPSLWVMPSDSDASGVWTLTRLRLIYFDQLCQLSPQPRVGTLRATMDTRSVAHETPREEAIDDVVTCDSKGWILPV